MVQVLTIEQSRRTRGSQDQQPQASLCRLGDRRHRGTCRTPGALDHLQAPREADFALIGAWQADYIGNLAYLLTAHNFNPVMALAGHTVIAEPESIVPVGVIPPDAVKTPGVLVDHLLIRAQ